MITNGLSNLINNGRNIIAAVPAAGSSENLTPERQLEKKVVEWLKEFIDDRAFSDELQGRRNNKIVLNIVRLHCLEDAVNNNRDMMMKLLKDEINKFVKDKEIKEFLKPLMQVMCFTKNTRGYITSGRFKNTRGYTTLGPVLGPSNFIDRIIEDIYNDGNSAKFAEDFAKSLRHISIETAGGKNEYVNLYEQYKFKSYPYGKQNLLSRFKNFITGKAKGPISDVPPPARDTSKAKSANMSMTKPVSIEEQTKIMRYLQFNKILELLVTVKNETESVGPQERDTKIKESINRRLTGVSEEFKLKLINFIDTYYCLIPSNTNDCFVGMDFNKWKVELYEMDLEALKKIEINTGEIDFCKFPEIDIEGERNKGKGKGKTPRIPGK